MSTNRSHWTCGLIYINADDPRLLVPLPCKLGLAVNFGNPRSVGTIFWIWLIWCMAFLFFPVIVHPSRFFHDPAPLLWVVLTR